jgi:hypothetical protein
MNEEKRQKAASHHQTIGEYVSFVCSMFIDPYDRAVAISAGTGNWYALPLS